MVHLDANGSELWSGGGFAGACSVSVNPTDGSCWVADYGDYSAITGEVIHLAENGAELWRSADFTRPQSVSVNAGDGSCWVADAGDAERGTPGDVVHLAENGSELWRGSASAACVSVNPTDGSCWVADLGGVAQLAQDGAELWRSNTLTSVRGLSVNATDGSCWVGDYSRSQVVHITLIANAGPDAGILPGGSTVLQGCVAAGAPPYTYSWSPTAGLSDPNIARPTASPSATTTYTLTVTDAAGRTAADSVTVTVVSPLVAEAGPDSTITAWGSTVLGIGFGRMGALHILMVTSNGLNDPNVSSPTAAPMKTRPTLSPCMTVWARCQLKPSRSPSPPPLSRTPGPDKIIIYGASTTIGRLARGVGRAAALHLFVVIIAGRLQLQKLEPHRRPRSNHHLHPHRA